MHHVLCFVRPPNHDRGSDEENGLGYLAAYVPGYRVSPFPNGMAKYVPAGSKLVFQMHYTPVGNEHTDLSKIGFIFAKPEELTHLVTTVSMDNHSINIPPHAEDYKREATMSAYKHDLKVLSFSPHMHLRGTAFSYEAIYPDGKREMLLNVPRYDFNWQTCYELAEPKTLPPGTRVHCVAHWDNSENNLANPNPAATVNWGDQTFEEMMIGFFDVAIPIDREKLLAAGTIPKLEPAATLEDRAQELLSEFDNNGDGKLAKAELPKQFQGLFGLLDRNRDGFLDAAEVLVFVKASAGRRPGSGGGERKKPAAQTKTPAGNESRPSVIEGRRSRFVGPPMWPRRVEPSLCSFGLIATRHRYGWRRPGRCRRRCNPLPQDFGLTGRQVPATPSSCASSRHVRS